MLAILNRYKVLFILLSIILFILALWLFITEAGRNERPTRGVFVIEQQTGDQYLKEEFS